MEISIQLFNKSGVYKLSIKEHSYIGSTSNLYSRLKSHGYTLYDNKHHNRFLQNCYNKYNCIDFETLELCDKSELIKKECLYIRQYTPDLNMKHPMESNAGFHITEDHKEKIREFNRNRIRTQEEMDRRIKSLTGKKRSQEICDKFKITNANQSIEQRRKLRYKNQYRILEELDVVNIRNRLLNKERVVLLAKEYGVSVSTIYKIKENKRWKFL